MEAENNPGATLLGAAEHVAAAPRPVPVPSSPARLSTPEAHRLGRRLQSTAVRQARVDHDFCALVDLFDAGEGYSRYDGVKSTAHYLGWACGVAAGAAREHVRVARALREMPHTSDLFAQGRLSYSKVRELTRVVGVVDERKLCQLALLMTASQLARTVSGYRLAAGTRIKALATRRYSSVPLGDGMVRISVTLPAEEAALVDAAVESACRTLEHDARTEPQPEASGEPQQVPGTGPTPTFRPADRVQALLDVASTYLDQAPGEPADDHTLVVVHVDAAGLDLPSMPAGRTLASNEGDVPAGTPNERLTREYTDNQTAERSVDETVLHPVPQQSAGQTEGRGSAPDCAHPDRPKRSRGNASEPPEPFHPTVLTGLPTHGVCTVEGQGPIEPATAQRLTCNALLQGVIRDTNGTVLALGRTRRLASRAQRRALRIQDHGVCQFPGCTSTHHLDAHHVIAWSAGGPTDLANLILLCRRHHTFVHEGGARIQPATRPTVSRWEFWLPDGRQVRPDIYPVHADPDFLTLLLAAQAVKAAQAAASVIGGEGRTADAATDATDATTEDDPDPTLIFPVGGGADFSLHDCLAAVFGMAVPTAREAA